MFTGLILAAMYLNFLGCSAYPHEPYVDTLYCGRRPKLVLTGTSIPLHLKSLEYRKIFIDVIIKTFAQFVLTHTTHTHTHTQKGNICMVGCDQPASVTSSLIAHLISFLYRTHIDSSFMTEAVSLLRYMLSVLFLLIYIYMLFTDWKVPWFIHSRPWAKFFSIWTHQGR